MKSLMTQKVVKISPSEFCKVREFNQMQKSFKNYKSKIIGKIKKKEKI